MEESTLKKEQLSPSSTPAFPKITKRNFWSIFTDIIRINLWWTLLNFCRIILKGYTKRAILDWKMSFIARRNLRKD